MTLKDRLFMGRVFSPDDPMGGDPSYEDPTPEGVTPDPEPVDDTPTWVKDIQTNLRTLQDENRTLRESLGQVQQRLQPKEDEVDPEGFTNYRTLQRNNESILNQVESMIAPLVGDTMINKIGSGLNDTEAGFLREHLGGLSPRQLQALSADGNAVRQVRAMARGLALEAGPQAPRTQAPRASTVQNPTVSQFNTDQQETINWYMNSFGVDRKAAEAAMSRANDASLERALEERSKRRG